jgi:hypothetical protein
MAITLVQKAGAAYTSNALAFGSNNTAGNFLIAIVRCQFTGGTITVSDTQGNTWNYVRGPDAQLGPVLAYAMNCKAGANTVTWGGPGQVLSGGIAEYSGIAKSNALDVSNNTGTGTGTAVDSGAVNTNFANELLIAALSSGNKTISSASMTEQEPTSGTSFGVFFDRIVSATGSYKLTCTLGSSATWATALASFVAASGVPNSLMLTGCGT